MRSLIIATLVVLVGPRPAEACCAVAGGACGYGTFSLHELDPAYADDTAPPSEPAVEVQLTRYDQGCGSHGLDLELTMTATDDRAPADRLGFLITVASGDVAIDVEATAIVPYGGPVAFYFAEDELPFAGELEVRAVDLAGNLGPPTLVEISSSGPSRKRVASVRGSGPLITCGLVGGALAFARRRRRPGRR